MLCMRIRLTRVPSGLLRSGAQQRVHVHQLLVQYQVAIAQIVDQVGLHERSSNNI